MTVTLKEKISNIILIFTDKKNAFTDREAMLVELLDLFEERKQDLLDQIKDYRKSKYTPLTLGWDIIDDLLSTLQKEEEEG